MKKGKMKKEIPFVKQNRLMKEAQREKPSLYFRFHMRYQGYNFYRLADGAIFRKGQFWDRYREKAIKALSSINMLEVPAGFQLIENPAYKKYLLEEQIKEM